MRLSPRVAQLITESKKEADFAFGFLHFFTSRTQVIAALNSPIMECCQV
jgi:hypothetical protein